MDSALLYLLMAKTLDFPFPANESPIIQLDEINNPELEEVKKLVEKTQSNDSTQDHDLNTHKAFMKVVEEIDKTKQSLITSRTASLSIQYMKMVDSL